MTFMTDIIEQVATDLVLYMEHIQCQKYEF